MLQIEEEELSRRLELTSPFNEQQLQQQQVIEEEREKVEQIEQEFDNEYGK